MKITTKTTKGELKKFLGDNASAVKRKDKDLFDRLVYADKMLKKDEKKVTRKDLCDLAKDVMTLLGDKVRDSSNTPPLAVVENSVKKSAPKNKVADEVATTEEPKKPTKKTLNKKKSTPKEDKVVSETPTEKSIELATMFPKKFKVDDVTYEIAKDIKTMNDLFKAIENEEEIVFAFYWTKRHLKQFPYFEGTFGQPEFFEHDLDLASLLYVSDEKKVAYPISVYTEALYMVLPEDLIEEDGLRMSKGIEFQIYRPI